MNRRRSIIVRSNNPFYQPTFIGDRVFIPTGAARIITYHARQGASHWNPAYWSKKMAPADRAVLYVGRDATRGSKQWPKGSTIPLGRLADEVSDYRSERARAGGATVVSQLGRYVPRKGPLKGKIVREKSVSVAVIREPHETWGAFVRNVRDLAKMLVAKYGQYEIFVDFIRNGRTVETRVAFWK
jgi:hypothetical protein